MCYHGADIEARDIGEWRTIHRAANYGHISIVKELIEVRNADINAREERGRTALWFSRYKGRGGFAAYLVSLGGIV